MNSSSRETAEGKLLAFGSKKDTRNRRAKMLRTLGKSTTESDITEGCSKFLRATAAIAVVHLSHRNSVCLSVTWVDQPKTLQARITKSSPSAAGKTLVSGSIKIFHKFHRGHPKRGR